jgi:hypothetical protein
MKKLIAIVAIVVIVLVYISGNIGLSIALAESVAIPVEVVYDEGNGYAYVSFPVQGENICAYVWSSDEVANVIECDLESSDVEGVMTDTASVMLVTRGQINVRFFDESMPRGSDRQVGHGVVRVTSGTQQYRVMLPVVVR